MIKERNEEELTKLERSIKSDSYIFAIQNNRIPLNLNYCSNIQVT